MKKRKKGENDKKFKTNNKLSGKIFPLDLYRILLYLYFVVVLKSIIFTIFNLFRRINSYNILKNILSLLNLLNLRYFV